MAGMEKSGALRQKMLVLSGSMIFLGTFFIIGGIVCLVQRYAPDPYDPLNDDDTYLLYAGIVLLANGLIILPTWAMILCGVVQQNPTMIPTGCCLCCFVGLLCQGSVTKFRDALLEDLEQQNTV